MASVRSAQKVEPVNQESVLRSSCKTAIPVLPIEVRVFRFGETFKEWTARAKRCSIEASASGNWRTMRRVAERLDLTRASLKGHLHVRQTHREGISFEVIHGSLKL